MTLECDFGFSLFVSPLSLSLVWIQKPWGTTKAKSGVREGMVSRTLRRYLTVSPSVFQSLANTCPSFILPRPNFLFSHPSTNDLHPFIPPPSLLNPSLLHYFSFPPSMGGNKLNKFIALSAWYSLVCLKNHEGEKWKWNRNCDTIHLHTLKQNNGSS